MRATRFAAIVFGLGATWSAAPARAEPPEPAPPAGGAPAPAKGPPAIRFTLVEKGAEPRAELRYKLKTPAKDRYEIVNVVKTRTGDAAHLTVQTTTMTGDWSLEGLDEKGFARARMGIGEMKLDMPGQPSAGSPLEGLRMHVGGKVSPLGGWTDVEFAVDEDPSGQMKAAMAPMMDSMTQMMGQITAQFPTEPVGVGAKWTMEVTVAMLGMSIATKADVTLASWSGDAVVLTQASTGGVKDQTLQMPGIEAKVLDMSVTGTGSTTIDLTRALPDAMQTTAETTGKMQFKNADGTPRDMDLVSTTEMKLTRKP